MPKNHYENYGRPKMKTPREVLFERHWAARPKLDAIRRESVEQAALSVAKPPHPSPLPRWGRGGMPVLRLIWLELILPSRRIWAGLAVVWILILAANFSMRDHAVVPMAKTSSPTELITEFQQQQELLAQLIGPDEPIAAEPQKTYVPRPSSRRSAEVVTV
jgi:hypothetical protein